MAKNCIVCGKKIGFFDFFQECKDGLVCKECFNGMGFVAFFPEKTKYTLAQLKELGHEERDRLEAIRQAKITDDICPAAKFDDISRQMLISCDEFVFICKDPQMDFPEKYTLISYDQIEYFELIEDGKTITNGVGRAVAGGVLFGGAGAVVGALTAEEKGICNELKIKIQLRNSKESAYIILISRQESKNSDKYKKRREMAQAIISKLQQITSSLAAKGNNQLSASDPFADIRKYKSLLDDGIISQEEFDRKKKRIAWSLKELSIFNPPVLFAGRFHPAS